MITTDVLAEGINLHRANVLVNYDLPWNPTRIMLRVGRINRVGSEFGRIFVYNFFPTVQTKEHMPFEERILEKLQAFHDTLGEDIKYLSEDEETKHMTFMEAIRYIQAEPDDNQPFLCGWSADGNPVEMPDDRINQVWEGWDKKEEKHFVLDEFTGGWDGILRPWYMRM